MNLLAQATPSTDQIAQAFGWPAAIVIIALVGVIIYRERKFSTLQDKYDALQERRVEEAKETMDKVSEPLKATAALSKQIYDAIISGRGK